MKPGKLIAFVASILICATGTAFAQDTYVVSVHGKDNCILLDTSVAARMTPPPAGDLTLKVSGDAFYAPGKSHGKVFIRRNGDYLEALPIPSSTNFSFGGGGYGFFAFFADWDSLADNSGQITIEFFEQGATVPKYSLVVDGKNNCVLLDTSVAKRADIPAGNYSVEAGGNAYYASWGIYYHDKVFLRYAGPDSDHVEALPIGGSTELSLREGYPFYAFFADWASMGDNGGTGTVTLTVSTVSIEIDIKPGSDPNCFNLNGNGVIPVAVNGTADFEVEDVDVNSLLFDGLQVRVRGKKGPLCSFEDWNTDGYPDLICHFEDDTENWVGGGSTATLIGTLLDGTSIEGTDSICIVP